MSQKKTLLLHDTFLKRGETERMNISIATIYKGDIATSIWSTHSYDPEDLWYHGKIIEVFREYHRGWLGWIRMKLAFFFAWKLIRSYERLIFSGETLSAFRIAKPWTETLYYAHSLPYFLFDGRKEYVKTIPFFYHEFYHLALWFRKRLYISDVRKIAKVATNSEHNKKLLTKWTGRTDIDVIYPPVNMLRFRPVKEKVPYVMQEHSNVETTLEREIKDYYVSAVRLTENKQVDKVVHAFVHMPQKNLIVYYSPHDPSVEAVMKVASGSHNIFFINEPLEMRRSNILANAVASIAVAKYEDFWVVAVESMACGIPVIAVNNGGFPETLVPEKTGHLLPVDFTVYQLMEAVEMMTPERSLSMREDCIERARFFALDTFASYMQNYFPAEQKSEITEMSEANSLDETDVKTPPSSPLAS
jgi:glycosyltransferase involved in cell wall biosynthesis